MLNSNIAVLIHLFYTDMWDELNTYLSNLDGYNYDLYINLVNGYHDESIIDLIKKTHPQATIIKSPNKGVDVGGFLFLYQNLKKDYELILKLHTKKSLGLTNKPSDYVRVYGQQLAKEKGQQWFRRLMDGVLKNKERVNDIIELLSIESPFGMAGLDRETYIGPNVKEVKELCNIFSIPFEMEGNRVKNASFVGGTIFWVKNDILKKYLTEDNIKKILNLLPEGYQNEPSYNHALERLFGFMVYNEKKKILIYDTE